MIHCFRPRVLCVPIFPHPLRYGIPGYPGFSLLSPTKSIHLGGQPPDVSSSILRSLRFFEKKPRHPQEKNTKHRRFLFLSSGENPGARSPIRQNPMATNGVAMAAVALARLLWATAAEELSCATWTGTEGTRGCGRSNSQPCAGRFWANKSGEM